MMQKPQKKLSDEAILIKMARFCAYRERCQQEVLEKLKSIGIYGQKASEITAKLIALNYLNEERFAIAFAGGKNRTKGWGRNKIVYHLKQLNISEKLINVALQHLDDDDYRNKLKILIEKKWHQLVKKHQLVLAQQKLITFFVQKGYNAQLIKQLLHAIIQSQNE